MMNLWHLFRIRPGTGFDRVVAAWTVRLHADQSSETLEALRAHLAELRRQHDEVVLQRDELEREIAEIQQQIEEAR